MTFWCRARFAALSIILILCFTIPGAFYASLRKQKNIKNQIALHIKNENMELKDNTLKAISQTLYEESRHNGIDYRLVLALMKVESNFQHDAVSPMGARGLLQVKPSLAKYMANDMGIAWKGNRTIDEPNNNIRIGVRFLSQLVESFQDLNTALRAYNMGPVRTKELSPEKMVSPKGFPGLVLNEYNKNTAVLPDP